MRMTCRTPGLAAVALVVGLALAGCDDGGSTYDKTDPMPADSQPPTSAPLTPNPGLRGAGQSLSPPPKTDEHGIESGDEETGGNH